MGTASVESGGTFATATAYTMTGLTWLHGHGISAFEQRLIYFRQTVSNLVVLIPMVKWRRLCYDERTASQVVE